MELLHPHSKDLISGISEAYKADRAKVSRAHALPARAPAHTHTSFLKPSSTFWTLPGGASLRKRNMTT